MRNAMVGLAATTILSVTMMTGAAPAAAPIGHAATNLLDDLTNRDSHGDFDQSTSDHLAGQRKHLRALTFFRPQCGERVRSVTHDPGNQGKGFDIIN